MKSLSMTGFGRTDFTWQDRVYSLEIKCLNSKGLDLQVRSTEPWSSMEEVLLKAAQRHLLRGKVTVHIAPKSPPPGYRLQAEPAATLRMDLVANLIEQWNLSAPVLPVSWTQNEKNNLLQQIIGSHPGLFGSPQADPSSTDASDQGQEARTCLEQAFMRALEPCLGHRKAEGMATGNAVKEALHKILEIHALVQNLDLAKPQKIRDKVLSFAASWIQNHPAGAEPWTPDSARLEQEILFYLEKKDIDEELTRLQQHLSFANDCLMQEEEQGRRLGFIAQEIGRELNTIGSKASDFEIQRLVVLAKEHVERLKEHAANLL